MLHLPGKDKMTVAMEGGHNKVAVLDRKLVAKTPTYDIYRGDTGETSERPTTYLRFVSRGRWRLWRRLQVVTSSLSHRR